MIPYIQSVLGNLYEIMNETQRTAKSSLAFHSSRFADSSDILRGIFSPFFSGSIKMSFYYHRKLCETPCICKLHRIYALREIYIQDVFSLYIWALSPAKGGEREREREACANRDCEDKGCERGWIIHFKCGYDTLFFLRLALFSAEPVS